MTTGAAPRHPSSHEPSPHRPPVREPSPDESSSGVSSPHEPFPREPEPIRVLLAEDEVLLRDSLKVLIDTAPGMVAVGEAGTGSEAVFLARLRRPHVVLMDVRMPDMDGIEATRRICADPAAAGARVLILTTFDQDEYVYASLRAGASGFLVKSATAAELLTAVRVVASGEALLSPTVTRRLIADFLRHPQPAPARGILGDITQREQDVLTLVGTGMSNSEIAEHLHLTVGTVKTHIGRLLAKLRARDRAQLVIAAYESGLVPVPPP